MEKFHATLPRMKASKEIYPTEELESLVADVYTEVLKFLRQSTEYYRRPGYRANIDLVGCRSCANQKAVKLWHAVSRPPKMGLEFDVAKIDCKIHEVNEEINIKLHERVQSLQNQLFGRSIVLGYTIQRLILLDHVSPREQG